MTNKDFELIAGVIARNCFPSDRNMLFVHSQIAQMMADELAATNLRFDRAWFLDACGVQYRLAGSASRTNEIASVKAARVAIDFASFTATQTR
jgi:hypothetical protein